MNPHTIRLTTEDGYSLLLNVRYIVSVTSRQRMRGSNITIAVGSSRDVYYTVTQTVDEIHAMMNIVGASG